MAVIALALSNFSVVVKSSGVIKTAAPPAVVNSMDSVPTVYASSANPAAALASAYALMPNAMAPMPTTATVSDSITLSDPTFVRPSAAGAAGTPTTCPPSGNPIVHYKLYEFNLAACGGSSPVTISTCTGTSVDTVIYVYRKGDGSASTAASPTFMPGSACSNVVVSNNNNLGACGVNGPSSVTTNLPDGNIVVVVGTNFANQTGAFTLSVSSPTCVVTQVASCNASIDHTGQSFAAAGGSDNVNVTIGAACPWTATTSDSWINITSGAAGLGNGTVSYTVDPNSGAARTGSILIAGLTFNVTQEAGAVALPCIHDALVSSGPNYVRPSISSGGALSCPATGNPSVKYKAYEFDLSGCPSALITASTCTNGPCPGPVTLADTIVSIYRKSDGSSSTPGSPIFDPANPCTNAVSGNNNSAACGAGSQLSSVTQSLASGRFVVVVAAANGGDVGTFKLNVSTATAGCTVTLATTCGTVTGTVTPTNQTICPGSSANINVSVSGGTAPYSVSLNNGGGSMNGAGPFTFTVSPASTTTYTATGTDANGCPITMSGTATVNVEDTTPPTITCPAGTTAPADANCQAAVPDYASQASASDSCPGTVTKSQTPAAGTMVGLGPHTVKVTATDANGNTNSCDVTFTVEDTTPPTVTCPAGTTASADANCQAAVPDYRPATTASDNCTPSGSITLTQSPAPGTMVGTGAHTVTITATDQAGKSSNCQTTFTVVDTTGPSLTFSTQTISLWPPNHAYHTFNAASFGASAGDNCGGASASGIYIVSVTSDEVENGNGDGNTLNDIVIAPDCKSVQLRAERQNDGDGRVYRILFAVQDGAGNVTTASVTVTVPKSQNGAGAVDSGPHYTVNSACP